MRYLIATSIAAGLTAGTSVCQAPIVVLLNGSVQQPAFVLYDDGQVIFSRKDRYHIAHIDMRDPDAVLARLGIRPAFFGLKARYDMRPGVTDLETVFLYVWRGDSKTRVAVRAGVNADGLASSETPEAFREAFDSLVTFHAPDDILWRPATVRVFAIPYSVERNSPRPHDWPAAWPDTLSPTTTRRRFGNGDVYEIQLPIEHLAQLERLIAGQGKGHLVRMNGRTWAIWYFYPFKSDRWNGDFSSSTLY